MGIKNVFKIVIQLNFEDKELNKEQIDALHKATKNDFPILSEEKTFSIEHKFDKGQSTTTQIEGKMTLLKNNKEKIIVRINKEQLYLEQEVNNSINLDQQIELVNNLLTHLTEYKITRLGLRVINNIKDTSADKKYFSWSELFDDKFVDPELLTQYNKPVIRFLNLIEFSEEDILIRLQHGNPNKDHPAKIITKEYLIDIDASTREPLISSDVKNKLNELKTKINEINNLIKR